LVLPFWYRLTWVFPEKGLTTAVCLLQTACGIKELKFFGTCRSSDEADKLAKYLLQLPLGTHLIIVTVGHALGKMTPGAIDALCTLGVDIADVVDDDQTFAALVVVGSHCRTVYELYENDPAFLALQLNGMNTRIYPASCTSTTPPSSLYS